MEPNVHGCERIRELAALMADGGCFDGFDDGGARVAFEAHIRSCAECAAVYEELSGLVSELGNFPEPEFPFGLHGRIMAHVRLNGNIIRNINYKRSGKRFSSVVKHFRTAAAAILAFVVVGAAFTAFAPTVTSNPTANAYVPSPRVEGGGVNFYEVMGGLTDETLGGVMDWSQDGMMQFNADNSRGTPMPPTAQENFAPEGLLPVSMDAAGGEALRTQLAITLTVGDVSAAAAELAALGRVVRIEHYRTEVNMTVITGRDGFDWINATIRDMGAVLSEQQSRVNILPELNAAEAMYTAKAAEHERVMNLFGMAQNITEVDMIAGRLAETLAQMDYWAGLMSRYQNEADSAVVYVRLMPIQ
jgi:hypothetical protein